MIFKIFWILRGLMYKPFFGKFTLPSYIGKPIFIGFDHLNALLKTLKKSNHKVRPKKSLAV
ncbi:MAG: hypothetical protein KN64_00480 [Sulfurovum sp. AS07-7]|nr:MAG: hypothetical protein KN64_00480 [Sulfurovum sp. AS07-7]